MDQKVCDLARAFSAAFVERAVDDNARADAQALLEVDPNLEEPDHVALAREVRLAFAHESAIVGG